MQEMPDILCIYSHIFRPSFEMGLIRGLNISESDPLRYNLWLRITPSGNLPRGIWGIPDIDFFSKSILLVLFNWLLFMMSFYI